MENARGESWRKERFIVAIQRGLMTKENVFKILPGSKSNDVGSCAKLPLCSRLWAMVKVKSRSAVSTEFDDHQSYFNNSDRSASLRTRERSSIDTNVKARGRSSSLPSDNIGWQNELHLTCQHYPRASTVVDILREDPSYASAVNSDGQTPLHVAAYSGASPQVIEKLVEACPCTASTVDYRGKTPLHLACETIWGCDCGNVQGDIVNGPIYEIISTLCEAASMAINTEDADGRSALEYAIENKASSKVVHCLHKASQTEWKMRRVLESNLRRQRRSSASDIAVVFRSSFTKNIPRFVFIRSMMPNR